MAHGTRLERPDGWVSQACRLLQSKQKKFCFRNEYHYEKSNILGAPPKLDDSRELLRNAYARNRRQQSYKSPSKGSQRISTSVLSISSGFLSQNTPPLLLTEPVASMLQCLPYSFGRAHLVSVLSENQVSPAKRVLNISSLIKLRKNSIDIKLIK